MRLSISMPKLLATLDSRWLPMNSRNTKPSNRRRSMLRVSSIIGSDIRATTQA